ncbi:mitochondrial 54S ribosomal protein mL57 [Aspergillus glaucus CBS 516.65]|uniref:RNase III domain-containing protein n=1 Tax=Aspergillus glaucus CBS 516.65 TaxID=1160497 RepID=A0A1L9V3C3_ASPGL|nr:hypothetical protein ASPGLDRAFT_53669 [Aspergillus glaucus CBS 516.65]XP_022397340.1 hypothetical protein ASPGLDRAFT_51058 [Aspergillus glaucus CBS 516.65]OJJ78416.1 hypothetical protein ASPGLDRAFT_53669 [Aspergillus glaucus CBS 516.65]OJJ80642.1 hypothetical protein ASPGLDRAFT_51058 [Aspergillus glaucus CBS 516.65]
MTSTLLTRAARPACRTLTSPSAILSTAQLPPPTTTNTTTTTRGYSTSTETTTEHKPRWAHTPPRAKAPFSLRYNSRRPEYLVNSDPKRLDQFYIRMLGEGGETVLSEEVKWLAVTHKSYDQGRRGFNDRLAFVGKRIVQLQTSLALVQNPANSAGPVAEDPHGRQLFAHPALEGLDSLSDSTKVLLTGKTKLAQLAQKYDMQNVLRWSPRKPNNLAASGIELVMAHTMYAVIGAIALEKGGHFANKVAQDRILEPLGVKTIA